MLVDESQDGVIGPVDFRSLSVREFGSIYEGLLESSLSIAPSDLILDKKGTYVPARPGDEVVVCEGKVYFHNRSGARKASGSYFTKPFAVEHLLDHALEPALDDHIARLEALLDAGEEAKAAEAFFDFRCVDLAMGSGHFLVAAVDRIEARLSAFLALHPIPHVAAELDRLRKAALEALGPLGEGIEIEYSSLLRRQVARRCVYGVDVNTIAVELARLGIWIHTFVPGLPLSFLDHSLVCGDSLTGIGTIDEAIEALDPELSGQVSGQISAFRGQILAVLGHAEDALQRLAHISEASKAEIDGAREAQHDAEDAVAPARDLFDLVLSARLGETTLPTAFHEDDIASNPDLPRARSLREDLNSLHFPIAFPEVFLRERSGFDCILGNPPWQEATIEELGFWALRYPGLKSMSQADQSRTIERLRGQRPDLVSEYEREVGAMEQLRELLLAGPFPGMGTGDPDLYKAFCWRFWQLVRDDGRFGVVLPRSALSAKGSAPWRAETLEGGEFEDVTMLLNNSSWVFEDVHPQFTIGLVSVRKGAAEKPRVRLRGPFASRSRFDEGVLRSPAELDAKAFAGWSEGASFPLLPSEEAVRVFLKLRAHPRLDTGNGWIARPYTELHATNDKRHLILSPSSTDGLWPVYKGASFDIWVADTGDYYAWADPEYITGVLQGKRQRARSAFAGFSREWVDDPTTLPCRAPRIAFRDVTNRTNQRTVLAALVPPEVVITNKGPYFLWPTGDERDQAYLLGVLCSIPLDWYARRFVEISLNFHILNAFPVPRLGRDDSLRCRVEMITGRLAAVDGRYASWAKAVGVPIASVNDEAEKADLVAELDAVVALLYGLDEHDLRVIYKTFHEGWASGSRLNAVLDHYRRLV
ncbi:MAG: Eco57I restriction-modification methylase domain-containing protein [Gaiellaceae bacterium]